MIIKVVKLKILKKDELKDELKAEKSRHASRLYRRRKKAFVEQLEQQMSTLIVEKDKLINERENMMAMLSKLISENSVLKAQQTKTTDQKNS